MFEWVSQPEAWLALLTLTAIETVLGIDNIIFISILASRVPEHQRKKARQLGLLLALVTRLLLLFSLSWMMGLTKPLFSIFEFDISGRDIILIAGGLFLLAKATGEVHTELEGERHELKEHGSATLLSVIVQIGILDIVFSLDSVITAIGLADEIQVMVIAIMIAISIMLVAAKPLSEYVEKHPTIKMLALSFLLLIGVTLIADGSGLHIPKGYIYFAMAFSFAVEMLNMRVRKRRARVAELASKGGVVE